MKYTRIPIFLVFVFCIFIVAGCALKQPSDYADKGYSRLSSVKAEFLVKKLSEGGGPNFRWTDLKQGIERNLDYLSHKNPDGIAASYGGMDISWKMLQETNRDLLKLLPELENNPELLNKNFIWFALKPRTFMTGYYEPWLEASLTPNPDYPYPLYSVPEDLKVADLGDFHPRWDGDKLLYRIDGDHIEPYFNRGEIDFEKALKGRGLEIAWVKNIVDVFVLQIQGSGRLILPDGRVKHILYAGRNGLQYVSLGKVLIEKGLMPSEGMSMQKIRSFLLDHPEMVESLLTTNPSYVFFRLADDGPFGSMNRPLTPMSSIAVDRSVVPLGAVAALTTRLPTQESDVTKTFSKIVMAQDTGGAIQGTRVDLFCGSGDYAEFLAGHLRSYAHIYLPVSREYFESAKDTKN